MTTSSLAIMTAIGPDLESGAGDARERLDVLIAKLDGMLDRLIALLPALVLAGLVVVGFWALASLVAGRDWLFRWIDNRFVRDLVRRITRAILVIIGFLIALELLDATALVGAVLGAAGVVGIAVGFAFRDLIENHLAGLFLSVRQPFEPNDFVSIDSHEGKVIRLTTRATILLTADGNHLRIPNAKVFKGTILNYTRNPKRRFELSVGVSTDTNLAEAQQRGLEILREFDAVLDEPEPMALIIELADASVTLTFYGWIDQRTADFFKARSEAIRLLKAAFDDEGIEMPEPIYRVHVVTPGEPARAIARESRRPSTPESTRAGDTSVDDHLDEQVRAERADEDDLLNCEAPRE